MIGLAAFAARLVASRSPGDVILGCLGVLSAAGSAGFAAYMVMVGPATRDVPPGGGDFPVFGAFDRRPLRQAGASRPPDALATMPMRSAGPMPSEIDFTPTGSIAPPRRSAAETMPNLTNNGPEPAAASRVLGGYALHDVFDGRAVIEVHNKLTIVEPGSTIEGAGPVLAIRRAGDHWIVETPRGVIAN